MSSNREDEENSEIADLQSAVNPEVQEEENVIYEFTDDNIVFDTHFNIVDDDLDGQNGPMYDLSTPPSPTPKLVFIVPYRDREQQLIFFRRQMSYVLEDLDKSEYKLYFIHQKDNRAFNRGALKNIGFLAVREKYPEKYRDITLVFNDIDTMPYSKNFLDYKTRQGIVKHFYGFTYALGGIVSINAGDFERIHGFPNFWAWGFEDNLLNARVIHANLIVDRTQFYPIADKNILQFHDGFTRNVNRSEFQRYANKTKEGWFSIRDLSYVIEEDTGFIHVSQFSTGTVENAVATIAHDLRKGNRPFPAARAGRIATMNMNL